MSSLMEFLHAAESLKKELRQAYKSNGLHETVAEHSWRLCLMAMMLSEPIEELDRDKCIRMALVHDLPEIYAGDAYRLDPVAQVGRHDKEWAALEQVAKLIPDDSGKEVIALWREFERGKTKESRFVRLIDRLEVLIQHNESDSSNWTDLEKRIQYGLAEKHAERYGFLKEFAREIDEETKKKLSESGNRVDKLSQEVYDRYHG